LPIESQAIVETHGKEYRTYKTLRAHARARGKGKNNNVGRKRTSRREDSHLRGRFGRRGGNAAPL